MSASVGAASKIGRDSANDVVLDDPNVSRFHAEVVRADGNLELRDLVSRNGTRLDGVLIERAPVQPGSAIGAGPFTVVFDGDGFFAQDDRGALRLHAEAVTVSVRDKQLLAPTTLTVEPGEFVAILGESGSGKTTLLKLLAGVTIPSQALSPSTTTRSSGSPTLATFRRTRSFICV